MHTGDEAVASSIVKRYIYSLTYMLRCFKYYFDIKFA